MINTTLRSARFSVPAGFYAVDRKALQTARTAVPSGEYHRRSVS